MQSKRIIFIELAIIVIVVFGFWSVIDRSEHKDTIANEVVNPTKAIDNHPRKEIKKEPVVSSKKDTSKKVEELNADDEVMYELSQQQFSEEPVVELLSILSMGEFCHQATYLTMNLTEEVEYSKQAKRMIAKNKESCQNLLDTYPSIGSEYNKSNKGRMLALKLASESHYADFVQKAMGFKFMDDDAKAQFYEEVFSHVLKSQSAPLISALQAIIRDPKAQMYMNKLSTVIGTLNIVYTRLILQQATLLYSCQYNQSITCSPTSFYMLEQCIEYEQACGLDLPTWFALNHTKAHNRDIAKMIAYFESL